jgi:hypothetical protein
MQASEISGRVSDSKASCRRSRHCCEPVLEGRRNRFCDLIEQIVRGAIEYRIRKGAPITRAEGEELNRLLLGVNFKIPNLCDPKFLESLPGRLDGPEPRRPEAPAPARPDTGVDPTQAQLRTLRESFLRLSVAPNRQSAGIELEQLLTRLFGLYGLAPEAAFRLQGEQVDGAFVLDSEPYLVEVKWTREPVQPSSLYSFTAKVEGKSHFTRGVFISVNGFSRDAVPALVRGKTLRIIMMDGAHLVRVLGGEVALPDLIRRLVQRLATRGEPYWVVGDMLRE